MINNSTADATRTVVSTIATICRGLVWSLTGSGDTSLAVELEAGASEEVRLRTVVEDVVVDEVRTTVVRLVDCILELSDAPLASRFMLVTALLPKMSDTSISSFWDLNPFGGVPDMLIALTSNSAQEGNSEETATIWLSSTGDPSTVRLSRSEID